MSFGWIQGFKETEDFMEAEGCIVAPVENFEHQN